jgi:hypothetical protein
VVFEVVGCRPAGTPVRVEVEKIDRPDARFAMTNNELSLALGTAGAYYLALLVGDGRYAKLMLLEPARDDLPRERVCRRWDWEFTDWARFATTVEERSPVGCGTGAVRRPVDDIASGGWAEPAAARAETPHGR